MKHTGTHTKRGFFTAHRISACVLLGFSLLMMGWIIPNGIAEGYDGGVISPTTVPMLFSALLGLLACVQLLQPPPTQKKSDSTMPDTMTPPPPAQIQKALGLFIIVLIYVYSLGIFGFLGATALLACAILPIVGNRSKIQYGLAIAVVPIGIWGIVVHILERPLP